ncbi:hypothetical protein DXG03_007178 [Asterophora parasitica]|uniref:Uncharacterized protein n=1 Tax=Asterophora parasitica TaxID=117018 RepID=A0A9P7K880_9AGAR|nr:hypothetical protein DXG03_007178 [Asterophora parasitica]
MPPKQTKKVDKKTDDKKSWPRGMTKVSKSEGETSTKSKKKDPAHPDWLRMETTRFLNYVTIGNPHSGTTTVDLKGLTEALEKSGSVTRASDRPTFDAESAVASMHSMLMGLIEREKERDANEPCSSNGRRPLASRKKKTNTMEEIRAIVAASKASEADRHDARDRKRPRATPLVEKELSDTSDEEEEETTPKVESVPPPKKPKTTKSVSMLKKLLEEGNKEEMEVDENTDEIEVIADEDGEKEKEGEPIVETPKTKKKTPVKKSSGSKGKSPPK